jgi:hypothetical protein
MARNTDSLSTPQQSTPLRRYGCLASSSLSGTEVQVGDCHKHLWLITNRVQVSSTQETLQSTGFYSNKSTGHSHMDPNVLFSVTHPSRNLLRPSPSLAHRVTSSQLIRGVQPSSGESLWPISVAGLVSQFTGDTWSSGEGAVLSSGDCLCVGASG